MRKTHRVKAVAAMSVLLMLAACGGGDGGSGLAAAASQSGTSANTAGAPNTGQIASDSFLSQVVAVIGAMSDATEPGAVDAVTVTTPETSESIALK